MAPLERPVEPTSVAVIPMGPALGLVMDVVGGEVVGGVGGVGGHWLVVTILVTGGLVTVIIDRFTVSVVVIVVFGLYMVVSSVLQQPTPISVVDDMM